MIDAAVLVFISNGLMLLTGDLFLAPDKENEKAHVGAIVSDGCDMSFLKIF